MLGLTILDAEGNEVAQQEIRLVRYQSCGTGFNLQDQEIFVG
jgi:hypothetical protein